MFPIRPKFLNGRTVLDFSPFEMIKKCVTGRKQKLSCMTFPAIYLSYWKNYNSVHDKATDEVTRIYIIKSCHNHHHHCNVSASARGSDGWGGAFFFAVLSFTPVE